MPRVFIANHDRPPTVIEFFGLPGAGKTTVANYLAEVLRERGYDVQTTADFVSWLSKQTKLKKLGFLVANLHGACHQLFWCMLFGIRLRPLKAISFSRIVRVPYINVCFERYLNTLDNAVVVMDQANMQLVWSIGAFSMRYDKVLLRRACKATVRTHPHYFVCLIPNVVETSERLHARKSNDSRFDALRSVQLNRALGNASRIVTDIRGFLDQEDRDLVDIDSTLAPEENAHRLASLLQESD